MVEFRSTCSGEKSTALLRHNFKKLWVVFVLTSLFMILVGVIGIVGAQDGADLAAAIGLLVLGVLFSPFFFLLALFLQKRTARSTSFISDQTVEVYCFDEQGFTLTQTRGEVFHSTLRASYSYVYKAVEDRNYLFLYVSRNQCHVLDMRTITQGTPDQIRTLFRTHLGPRFRSKSR